ncbi:hypothetical protein [Polaribacter sp.]|uniref:hypothetical protein n=1 Tax=Polaribacter sp. TaxID=1920175 RepID=UPI003F6BD89C
MDKRSDSENSWVRQVIIVVSAILGLIITLKKNNSENNTEHILFVITIISNALCILVGLIFLYRDTSVYQSLSKKYIKYITLPLEERIPKLIFSAPNKIYDILKGFFFVLLFSSVISLVIYAIHSDVVKPEKNQIQLQKMKEYLQENQKAIKEMSILILSQQKDSLLLPANSEK